MDGKELVKQTLDQIPQANSNAKRIVGLVKEGGRITGYQLSDNSIVEKQQAVNMPTPAIWPCFAIFTACCFSTMELSES